MTQRSASLALQRSRVSFALWGWVMLLVIMLSAAPTGGAPRTQLFGSAFDPATHSVTTAPKRQSLLAELQTEDTGDPDDAPTLDYPQPVETLALPAKAGEPTQANRTGRISAPGAVPPVIADNRAARAPPSI